MNKTHVFLLCFFAILIHGAHSFRIYTVSNELDRNEDASSTWTKVPFYFGTTEGIYVPSVYPVVQLGIDRTGDLFVTALNGVPNQRAYVTAQKWNTTTNTLITSTFYIGRFAFDRKNNFYSVDRYNPAGSILKPIVRIPADNYTDDFILDRFIGWADNTHDITSVNGGRGLVVVGDFDTILKTNEANASVLISGVNHVALYDTKTKKWSKLGDGLPVAPTRIVSDPSGDTLVAFASPNILWRWDDDDETWERYDLELTGINSGSDGVVNDLGFGKKRLFLLGEFSEVNGVKSDNVSFVKFVSKAPGGLKTVGIGSGLLMDNPLALAVRSNSEIYIGGSTGGLKSVWGWKREDGNGTWASVGNPGFTPGTDPVVGLTILE